jgi:hypothetical protein
MPVLSGSHAVPPVARWSKNMPIDFLHGRPLSPEELEMIRQQIEEGFDNIAVVDDEIRGILARNWPHLLSKFPWKTKDYGPGDGSVRGFRRC